jgi:hypothetical protein
MLRGTCDDGALFAITYSSPPREAVPISAARTVREFETGAAPLTLACIPTAVDTTVMYGVYRMAHGSDLVGRVADDTAASEGLPDSTPRPRSTTPGPQTTIASQCCYSHTPLFHYLTVDTKDLPVLALLSCRADPQPTPPPTTCGGREQSTGKLGRRKRINVVIPAANSLIVARAVTTVVYPKRRPAQNQHGHKQ